MMGTEEKIWSYLTAEGLSAYGVAGLMGNLYAESGLSPINLQNSYEGKLGMTDADYTAAVDNGTYTKFADKEEQYGYGIAQWTFYTRKAALLAYARASGKSIGDLEMQLGFLIKELNTSYSAVLDALKKATSVREASDAVLLDFEQPADKSEDVRERRARYGQAYFDKYAKEGKEDNMNGVTVKAYSKAKNGATKLSTNFKVSEFACKDGSDTVLVSPELVTALQKIRDHFGKSVVVNSGYRTEAYNKQVGGAAYSQHKYGLAADIAVSGITPLAVAQYAQTLLPSSGGIGLYSSFVHVDVRAAKARWDQRSGKQVVVSGF